MPRPSRRPITPIKPGPTILDQEIAQASEELKRPALGLFLSGLLAGFGIGVGLLLMAVIRTLAEGVLAQPVLVLLEANAYAAGLIIVVLGQTDLFTEYTTMALLPVLGEEARLQQAVRLWGIVYIANLVAAAGFAAMAAKLGPALGTIDARAFGAIAQGMVGYSALVLLFSATLAGWLMGLLSWLVSAARETISQIFFVWLIGMTLALAGLHHAIIGTVEVLAAVFAGQDVTWAQYGWFLGWATLGNIIGGVVFAVTIRYSVILGARRSQHKEGVRGQKS